MSEWIRPAGCDSGSCVEYRTVDGRVFVRSSEDPNDMITFTVAEWDAFVAGLTAPLREAMRQGNALAEEWQTRFEAERDEARVERDAAFVRANEAARLSAEARDRSDDLAATIEPLREQIRDLEGERLDRDAWACNIAATHNYPSDEDPYELIRQGLRDLAAENARLRQSLTAADCEVESLRAGLADMTTREHNENYQRREAEAELRVAIAEAAVLGSKVRRMQPVVEAAQAWLAHRRSPDAFTRQPRAELIRLADALDALQNGPAPAPPLPAEQPPVEALATDGAGAQGEAQGAAGPSRVWDKGEGPVAWLHRPERQRAEATCGAEYARPGGRQRGDRIVRCDRPEHVAWESHQEGETGVEWYEPEVAAAYGVPVREPRVWNAGDREPEGVVEVLDVDGDRWRRLGEQWGYYLVDLDETNWVAWDALTHSHGPLTEVLPEPAPATGGIIPAGNFVAEPDPVEHWVPFTNTTPSANRASGTLKLTMDNTDARFVPTCTCDLCETGRRVYAANHPDGEVPEAGRAGEAPVVCPDTDAPCEPLCDFCTAEARDGEAQDRTEDDELPAPEVGSASAASLDLIAQATGGGARSRDVAPTYEDQDRTEGLDAAIEAALAVSLHHAVHERSTGWMCACGTSGTDRPEPNSKAHRHLVTAELRAASPLIERAALLAAADDFRQRYERWTAAGSGKILGDGIRFAEGVVRDRATRTGGA